MFLALSATSATIGLGVTFFVVFPIIAQGLIGYAIAIVMGERADNEAYRAGNADSA
jgi:hypothetical protein